MVLALLAFAAAVLVPAYVANWQLQRFIASISQNSPGTSAEAIRAEITNKAASLGLPVHSDDVSVNVTKGAVAVKVLYAVHVDVAGYTVDLHFRPSAGS